MDGKEEKGEIANLQLAESELVQGFVHGDHLKSEVKTSQV